MLVTVKMRGDVGVLMAGTFEQASSVLTSDSFQWEIVRCLWITEINCEVHNGEKPTSRDSELLRKKLELLQTVVIMP